MRVKQTWVKQTWGKFERQGTLELAPVPIEHVVAISIWF